MLDSRHAEYGSTYIYAGLSDVNKICLQNKTGQKIVRIPSSSQDSGISCSVFPDIYVTAKLDWCRTVRDDLRTCQKFNAHEPFDKIVPKIQDQDLLSNDIYIPYIPSADLYEVSSSRNRL